MFLDKIRTQEIDIKTGEGFCKFGGGGSSKSSTTTTTDQSTKITTNTTTSLADFEVKSGFTGDNAIEFAQAIGTTFNDAIASLSSQVEPFFKEQFNQNEQLIQGSIAQVNAADNLISKLPGQSDLLNPDKLKENFPKILAGVGVAYALYELSKN
jgi:hypothetical protein